MATLSEIAGIRGSVGFDALLQKVVSAVKLKAAEVVLNLAELPSRRNWAVDAGANATSAAEEIVDLVIAKVVNEIPAVTVDGIINASDGAIQTHVTEIIDAIYT